MNKYVIISDLQVPYHDKKAVEAVTTFVAGYQPDALICVGDEADSPEVSRWSKAGAEEYAGTLQKGLDETRRVMAAFRAAIGPDKSFIVSRSNHVDRIERYVGKYAPALAGLRALRTEELLGYDQLGIDYRRRLSEIAPGWVLAHGDEGTLSRYAGGTAVGLAKKIGKSVVCGHSHRAGIVAHSAGYNGRTATLTGMEVGHLMNPHKATWLPTGAGDWQQAFGILYVEGRDVTPVLVPVRNGKFTVEGVRYAG